MTDAPPTDAPKNLPAKSDAERQRERMEKLLSAVEARAEMLTTLLAETGISFERFLEVFRRALIRNPDLVIADAGSVVEACINACTDGLLPDGRQGALVIYNVKVSKRGAPDQWMKRATWIPMYQGLLDIAYSSGNFRSIECRVVYEGDAFEYDLGDDPFIKHRPKARAAGTKQPEIVAAYAVAKTVNGGVFREIFEGADIAKVNAVSRATSGPMKNWPEEAARKGPLRRMWKFLPKNEAMNRIVERDNEGFDLAALEPEETGPVRERRLSPGFAPAQQQLTEGADPVMPAADADKDFTPVSPEREAREGEHVVHDGPVGTFGTTPTEDEDEPAAGSTIPEVIALDRALAAAVTLRIVKNALETFAKSELGQSEWGDAAARRKGWLRMCELRAEGKDKTDFVEDPILFEMWLLGADPQPHRDTVEGNWAIVQTAKTYERLPEPDRTRIMQRVSEALGAQEP